MPKHIAIVMDGNRRWAREQGLALLQGHLAGYDKLKQVGDWCLKRGIKILTIYAFSTENWNRKKNEVNYLMRLLKIGLTKESKEFYKRGIQLRVFGRISGLSKDLQTAIKEAVEKTKTNTKSILNIAINYGGRAEIVDAIKNIVAKEIPASKIDEETVNENIYTAGLPDPELIIRTSGEYRLSGFLTWQSVYSELYFCPKYWPAFSEKDLDEALEEYARRQRRFGK
ncbi:di-trans,poly-cis-decaprenylcistransferase [Patescibacteria group bacterium]|nr:di-trans,poly-cis-decaprenylcistransferase [Patescibacteria group bacterium]MBU4512615.1 di-trans,poly-cis-decaprenylcistransferase [Patescibacteria group bacterium]